MSWKRFNFSVCLEYCLYTCYWGISFIWLWTMVRAYFFEGSSRMCFNFGATSGIPGLFDSVEPYLAVFLLFALPVFISRKLREVVKI